MRNLPFFVFVCLALSGCGSESGSGTDTREAAVADTPVALEVSGSGPAALTAVEQIEGDYMRDIVVEISSDAYEGRGPGTAGDQKTRQWLIGEMQRLGLEPGAADGGWEQEFELVSMDNRQPDTWTFDKDGEALVLDQWDDFIVSSGVQQDRTAVSGAELVFVGYGMQAPEFEWDDYKGADLEGKILVMMNNDPDWDPDLFGGETRLWYGRWDYKYLSAARQGAAGAIIIHTTPSAGYPFQVLQTSGTTPDVQLPAGDEPRNQIEAWATEDAVRRIFDFAGYDLDELREAAYNRDFEPVPLGVSTSFEMDVEMKRIKSANVLGLIPGSDPELADEAVIYTAHHDHLGIGTPNADGDAIYNGALDNASGVAQVLAIARALVALPEAPRRSTLIAMVGAEEQGLLGSLYYADNPTFAPGKIAANLNYDGGNIWGHTHDLTFIGLGKSSIDRLVEMIAGEQGREVKPDQFADKGYFYRSDQFSFAKIGVPAMYLDTGTNFVDRPPEWGRERVNNYTNIHYHQPTDEYDDSWNFDGMEADAELGFWTGLAIANADEMPRWNPGDEFEAARLEALKAVGD